MRTERVLPLDDIGWTQRKKKRHHGKGFEKGRNGLGPRKLSDKQVTQIRGLCLRHGWSSYDVAEIFGICRGSVNAIATGITHVHVIDEYIERENHPKHRT